MATKRCREGHEFDGQFAFCPHCGSKSEWTSAPAQAHARPPLAASSNWGPDSRPSPIEAESNTLSIIAMVSGGISFLLFPIIFGPAGLILAAVALTKKERLAPVALAVAASGMIVGMIIGALVYTA